MRARGRSPPPPAYRTLGGRHRLHERDETQRRLDVADRLLDGQDGAGAVYLVLLEPNGTAKPDYVLLSDGVGGLELEARDDTAELEHVQAARGTLGLELLGCLVAAHRAVGALVGRHHNLSTKISDGFRNPFIVGGHNDFLASLGILHPDVHALDHGHTGH